MAIEAGECRQSDENQAQKENETVLSVKDVKEYPFLPSFHCSEICNRFHLSRGQHDTPSLAGADWTLRDIYRLLCTAVSIPKQETAGRDHSKTFVPILLLRLIKSAVEGAKSD